MGKKKGPGRSCAGTGPRARKGRTLLAALPVSIGKVARVAKRQAGIGGRRDERGEGGRRGELLFGPRQSGASRHRLFLHVSSDKAHERRMNTPTPTTTTELEDGAGFNPIAAALGWLLPGAGHAYLGERRRGWLIGGGVLGMFVSGLFIGGIDVVDKREDFVWFIGQSLVGPVAFGTDYVHQHRIKVRDPRMGLVRSAHPYEIRHPQTGEPIVVRDPATDAARQFVDPATGQVRLGTASDRPPNTKSLGRVNELGTLFCTIAGMLNLIAIIDASTRRRGRGHRASGGGL